MTPQFRAELIHRLLRGQPETGQCAEAVGPQFLTVIQSQKNLGSALPFFPVSVVLVADDALINGDPRLPVTAVFGLRHAGEIGRPFAPHRRMIHWQHRMDGEGRVSLIQLPGAGDTEIFHSDGIPRFHSKVIRQPLGDEHRSLRPLLRQSRSSRRGRGRHGVRRAFSLRTLDFIHQISQHAARFRKGFARRLRCLRRQKNAAGGKHTLIPHNLPGKTRVLLRKSARQGLGNRCGIRGGRKQEIRFSGKFR